ncbi:glycosyltransferase [Pseudokineococcus sp. 1T1Z-3]|uniref:glycosyltransferase n=1 Tax=Pseudokineococcus sp. 1T1Z-3 TaxID=3132745 RepID=UPI0030A7D073
MSGPRWSVVVPSYDRPEELARLLGALSRLQVPAGGLEVLVVDDGGRRPAADVVARVPTPHRVRVHRQPNAGPAAARNAGAARAEGELLALTDDDCAPTPGWLTALEPHLHADDVLVGGRTVNALRENLYAEATQSLVSTLVEPAPGRAPTFFPTCNLAVRTHSFAATGGFDESFPRAAGEDRAFCDAWRAAGGTLVHEPGAVVEHAHALTLRGFWRQHRGYGAAAPAVHRRRAAAGLLDAGHEPPDFFWRLLTRPLREQPLPRAVPVLALVGLSQVATAAGRWRAR